MAQERSMNPFSDSFIDEEGPFGGKTARKQFVAKVYLIVTMMLIPPFGLSFLPFTDDDISEWLYNNFTAIWISGFVLFLVSGITVFCSPCARLSPVCGWVLLTMMVASMCLIVPCVSNFYDARAVFYALPTTIVTVFLVALLARYGSCDVTGCGMVFKVMGLLVAVYGLVVMIMMFFHPIPILHTVYVLLIAILSVLYLWFDLQLIMGGRSHELSEDEYILAAALLFTDIITLFLSLIQLIGGCLGSE